MRPPGSRSFYVGMTFLLAAGIVAALVVVSRHYFFEAKAYEFADLAANSLEVLQAKNGTCTTGPIRAGGSTIRDRRCFTCSRGAKAFSTTACT